MLGVVATVACAEVSASSSNAQRDSLHALAVPAGPVVIGDHEGQYDEKPPIRVYVSAFRIDRCEVSRDRYDVCVAAGKCAASRTKGPANHPVTGVTWTDAANFCRFSGGRLPTEAEWEKAARGDDQRRFPWGNASAVGKANCGRGCGVQAQGPRPCGAFPAGASAFGAMDMGGNVSEWVADWYGEGYFRTCCGSGKTRDPKGPVTGIYRSVRGGEYTQEYTVLRAANRYWGAPDGYHERRGFRCAR